MVKKVYIAGKVTGEDRLSCALKFANAASVIEIAGHEPVNPLLVVGSWDVTWNEAMRKCIKALMDCDAIYLLPDWGDSPGAKIEGIIGHCLNIPQFEEVPRLISYLTDKP